MNIKALVFISIGVVAGAAVMSYDIIAGKPENDFTGPVSTPALVICAILIVIGIVLPIRKRSSKARTAR